MVKCRISGRLRYLFTAIALCLASISNPRAQAAELVLGVGTHLTRGKAPIEKTLNGIYAIGATSLRDDATWAVVERKKGELSIPLDWDKMVDEARKRHIEPLLILTYGNQFYDDGKKPHSPDAVAAFARYAAFVVQHFKGRILRYEVWNEWDITTGDTQPGTPEDYVNLVRAVYPAIKAVDPKVEVLVGAVGPESIKSGYLNRIIKLGVLDFADGLSLHTYLHCRRFGSDASAWVSWMQDLEHDLSVLVGHPQSFYITEIGWPSHSGKCGISEGKQAEYLKQMFLSAREMPFIKGVWWYDFRNDGVDPTNQEHNFGLVRNNFSEKPAYRSFKSISGR